MLEVKEFYDALIDNSIDFFAGVPDSLLKDICGYIVDETPSNKNFITANEGAAIALGVGYHISTGKVPLIYLQNSGLGNAINPLLSLADKEVYSIPLILLIGWRGEPGIKDEPQHIKQGRIQNALLSAMEIPYRIIDSTSKNIPSIIREISNTAKRIQAPVAIVVRKGTFSPYKLTSKINLNYEMSREKAIEIILDHLPNKSIIISTTGKASREVYEYRERKMQRHDNDFLTVGSMGHSSQIALGISLNTNRKVICLDGDGALIMHMGSLGIIGKYAPRNFYHILLNNGAHESVGGQATVGFDVDFASIALGCGYKQAYTASGLKEFREILQNVENFDGPIFFEVKVNKESRVDLGRPKSTPVDNKSELMREILNYELFKQE